MKRNFCRTWFALLAFGWLLIGQASAQFGVLDADFGGSGFTGFTPFPENWGAGSDEGPRRVIMEPDGALMLAGTVQQPLANGGTLLAPAMIRFFSDGRLDKAWGVDGLRVLPASPIPPALPGRGEVLIDMLRQSDGKWVGLRGNAIYADSGLRGVVVSRFLPDGTPDPTFNNTGTVVTPTGGEWEIMTSLTVQADGGITVAGSLKPDATTPSRFLVLRYLANGSPDLAFGGGTGRVSWGIPESAGDLADKMVLHPDGGIVVAGTTRDGAGAAKFALMKLLPDGALDPAFGGGSGQQTLLPYQKVNGPPAGLIVTPEGRILLAGTARVSDTVTSAWILAEYLSDGTPTYPGGFKQLSIASSWNQEGLMDLAQQPDGKLVLTGTLRRSSGGMVTRAGAVVRLLSDGTFDNSFNPSSSVKPGVVLQETGGVGLVAVQPDGKILTAGLSSELRGVNTSPARWALQRYLGEGEEVQVLDNSMSPSRSLAPDERELTAGYAPVGGSSTFSFTVRNAGGALLTGLSAALLPGNEAGDFSVSLPGDGTLGSGASVTGTVTFTPGAPGTRQATLRVTSSDDDENQFDIQLTGAGGDAEGLKAVFPNAGKPVVTAPAFNASGIAVTLELHEVPATGTEYLLVKQTGLDFVTGAFTNLVHGQVVNLGFEGKTWPFVVNYYGGSGNDIVLRWAGMQAAAWGINGWGQLGTGHLLNRVPRFLSETGVWGGRIPLSLAAGPDFSLAVMADGSVFGWGRNLEGVLGDGTTNTTRPLPTAVSATGVLAGKTVVAVAAGEAHTLALCSDGTVAAWGNNALGQLGDGTSTNRPLPVLVQTTGSSWLNGRSVVAIAAGSRHSLALCSDGTVASWGNNAKGELGGGAWSVGGFSKVPAGVAKDKGGLKDKTVVSLAAGGDHNLVLCSDNSLFAFGNNADGQCGAISVSPGLPTAVLRQNTVISNLPITTLSANKKVSQVMTEGGISAIWGLSNSYGYEFMYIPTGIPYALPGFSPAAALAGRTPFSLTSGGGHSVMLMEDGSAFSKGTGTAGQLGDNTLISRNTAVQVNTQALIPGSRLMSVVSGLGANHNLALVAKPLPPAAAHFAVLSIENEFWQISGGLPASWGNVTNDSAKMLEFRLQNDGSEVLSQYTAVIDGPDAADFTLTTAPSGPLAALNGSHSSFAISFTSRTYGSRHATLLLTSTDPGVLPFEMPLTAMRLQGSAEWRQFYFGNPNNSGDGADDVDFDHDGRSNFLEFATGSHPWENDGDGEVLSPSEGGFSYTYRRSLAALAEGVVFKPEWSSVLTSGNWWAFSAGSPVPVGLAELVTLPVPKGTYERKFVRLRVSR